MRTTRVLGFAGSLRKGSFNRALLEVLAERAPRFMEVEPFGLADIPMFDEDLETDGDPRSIEALKSSIEEADGLLIVTPEYNHGLPAVTKNAVDWASRPPEKALKEKPVAVAGASPGMTGTARAQGALRRSLTSVGAYVMPEPEVLVARAHEKFESGELVDEETEAFLDEFLESFVAWIRRFESAPSIEAGRATNPAARRSA